MVSLLFSKINHQTKINNKTIKAKKGLACCGAINVNLSKKN